MAKKTARKKEKKSNPRFAALPKEIIDFLNENADRVFSVRKIIRRILIKDRKTKEKAVEVIQSLSKAGKIREIGTNLYTSSTSSDAFEGIVDYVNPKFAYVVCEGMEKDIYVATEDNMHALDGDKVKVIINNPKGKGGRPQGYISRIIQRKKEEFVGHVEISTRFAFVVPDNKKMHNDIFVPLHHLKGAKQNDKVIVKMVRWPERDKNPTGEIAKVLGKSGENETEIHAIMAEFDLPFEFDEKVIRDAEAYSDEIPASEYKKRRDFRDVPTFTIDPLDAKDFDDAISLRHLENGNTEVGVHIADVSYYVRPDTALDKEAFRRGTSVYLVDRTVPMLPERLSNGLCSLRPNEEKLAFSAVFELNDNAKVINQWFGRTVIYSDRRFTYEEAQERIETVEGDYAKEVIHLNELALKLRARRFSEGSINFETTEVKFQLDEKGKPLAVIPKVRKDAHKLVEDFMLLANKKVAEFVFNRKKGEIKDTFVYRTHDYPNPEKLENFAKLAKRFGYLVKNDDKGVSNSLNRLLDDVEGKPEQNLLETIAIRTMAKAKYSTEEAIHFGLSFQHYSHFTSPIRRYPDLMVHRLLQRYLDGGQSADREAYEEYCRHCSERERVAADADRASIKYKQVEYMESLHANSWEGIVSGVTEWGIFVEISETHCEGMIRMADMNDDYYEFDEENFRVIGRGKKNIITLGDKVTVKVIKTDINRRTIDLAFVK